jgi:hypothetical protein
MLQFRSKGEYVQGTHKKENLDIEKQKIIRNITPLKEFVEIQIQDPCIDEG